MCLFPERPDSDSDWEHPEDGHHAVYFVKRPACAFISAAAKWSAGRAGVATILPTASWRSCGGWAI
jgi:hypothetical protein